MGGTGSQLDGETKNCLFIINQTTAKLHQFGYRVYSLVGQILLDFRPKLIYCILRKDIMLELTKIEHDYRK